MILAVDIGNTNIVLGVLDGEKILLAERVSTDRNHTELEYIVQVKTLLELYGINPVDLKGSIVSSVVPPLNNIIRAALRKLLGSDPLFVGPGVKNGVNIKVDNPASVGSDLIVDAVAAIKYYGAPCLIIDMGTATTISVVDEKKNYIGGLIMPGVRISLDALVSRTAQLPRISLDAPDKTIGTNTIDCMKSGTVIGAAASMDGLVERMLEELGEEAAVVATGGLAQRIVPHCRHHIILDNDLTLKGLGIIYEKNC